MRPESKTRKMRLGGTGDGSRSDRVRQAAIARATTRRLQAKHWTEYDACLDRWVAWWRGPPMTVIQILGLAGGGTCPFDGQYVVEYDPGRDGTDPDGNRMRAHVVCSPERAAARQFASFMEAFECWRSVDPRAPERPDGRPNRPLTAFSVEIL